MLIERSSTYLGIFIAASLAISLGAIGTDAAAATDAAGAAPADGGLEAQLRIRQGGGGERQGLLSKLSGPAAMLDIGSGARTFENIAGASSALGGKEQGYVAGSSRLPLLGAADLTLNYASAETGGMAAETRLARQLDAFRLTWSSTLNRGFESNWTGTGASRASRMNEGSLNWSGSPVPLGFGLRETTHIDGSHSTDLRTTQMRFVGSGLLLNSTATGLNGGSTSGTLMYDGPLRSFQLTAELDYGGAAGPRPSGARVGMRKTVADGWSPYLYAGHNINDASASRIDFGSTREIGGFVASAYGGAGLDGSAYMGLRLSVALSPGARRDRWMGLGRSDRL